MTLVMRTAKGAVSFEWSDEDAETVIKVEPTDPDEVMVRKLKRVIALAEGGQEPTLFAAMADAAGVPPEALRPSLPMRQPGASNPPANGWKAAGIVPELPERLQGEVELISPEGDA